MNFETFEKLEIQQQVDYINSQLLEGHTVEVIRLALGVGKNYIGREFKKFDYKLDRTINQYVLAGEVKAPTKKTSSQQKSNKSNDIKVLEDKINSLETQIKCIMDIINTKELLKTTNDSINVYEGSTVTRSYKINENVQQQFKLFCKKNNNHTISDIISSALDAFIKNNS